MNKYLYIYFNFLNFCGVGVWGPGFGQAAEGQVGEFSQVVPGVSCN